VEPVAGLLPVMPLLFTLLVAPLFAWRRRARIGRQGLVLLGLMLGIAVVILLLPIVTLPGATERLLVDTAGLLLLIAILAWLWLAEQLRSSPAVKRAVVAIGVAALAYGAIVNVALGLVGYGNGLRFAHPGIYTRLERAFAWIPTLAAKARGEPILLESISNGSNAEVQFAAPSSGVVELMGDVIPNPVLPRGSVVGITVRSPDRVIRRFPLVRRETVLKAGLSGSGLQNVRIRFEVVRLGRIAPPPPGSPGAVQGFLNVRMVGWSPR
jgi:hypothetical protein